MPVRVALLLLALSGSLAGPRLLAVTTHATAPALTFFSTLTEQPIARLEAEAIKPRTVRHGPFRLPAPGLALESPVLTLHDEPCSPDDWSRFLRDFAAWRRLPAKAELQLVAPDGLVFAFVGAPTIADDALLGLVRPLSAHHADEPAAFSDADTLRRLRVAHDGDSRLVLRFAPLPASTTPSPTPASALSEP